MELTITTKAYFELACVPCYNASSQLPLKIKKPFVVKILFLPSLQQFILATSHRQSELLISVGWVVTAALALAGCDKVAQITLHKNASTTASTTASVASTASATNPSTAHIQTQATPVVYPINQWQQTLASKVSVHDVEAIKSVLGQPVTIDTQSLDYRSNLATNYRFAKVAEPYFDLLDSPMYLELQWYYASAHDNATIKNISINHAKKAFYLTQSWFGQDGANIVANMLQGQPIHNKTYQGLLVELARCENYHCDLVVRKPASAAKAKQKRV